MDLKEYNSPINPINPVWNYDLGIKISDEKLYRIPKTHIPEGFVRVVKITNAWECMVFYFNIKYSPYDENNVLKDKYWSLPRWNECHF